MIRQARRALASAEIRELLDELDRRLRVRGVAGRVHIVGGAAVALTVSESRRTVDVDAVIEPQDVVTQESRAMAEEHGLPDDWLNSSAGTWAPARSEEPEVGSPESGLVVSFASPRELLAMKLVAARSRDASDLRALVKATKLEGAPASKFAEVLR